MVVDYNVLYRRFIQDKIQFYERLKKMQYTQDRRQTDKLNRRARVNMRRNYEDGIVAELVHNIAKTRLELEVANQNFSYVTEPMLVDMYAYQIKAAQAKYRYLLKLARELGVEQREYVERVIMDKANNL